MEELRKKANTFLLQFGTSKKKVSVSGGPIIFKSARDCYLYDDAGKEYIDALSGAWVVNSGHTQEEIIQGIVNQYNKLEYATSSEGYTNENAVILAEKLSGLLPGGDKYTYFTSGGSEAVEMALRFARLYYKIKRKRKKNIIVSRRDSYHGGTLLTLSTSTYDFISKSIGPVPEGIEKIGHPYCHRCELKETECGLKCAYELEEVIKANGPESIAAFIAEPISAISGIAIPKKEYWKVIRSICDKYDVLLIVDEVLTGFCRTGKFFAIEHYGIEPDIMTLSKGLTSGYAPLGAFTIKKEIFDSIPENAYFPPGFTYSGHPVSCAAALSNLDYMIKHKLDEASLEKGAYLLSELQKQLESNPYVSDIRGIGLLLCIELTESNEQVLTEYFLDQGLYTRVTKDYIHIAPPLTISEDVIKRIVDIVVGGLSNLNQ